jgi:hypothetical protein
MIVKRFIKLLNDEFSRREIKNGSWFVFDNPGFKMVEIVFSVEARQIYNAIRNKGGWSNHPAIRMWAGYENALLEYSNVIIEEWIRRGFKNTMALVDICGEVKNPPWLGDEVFHSAHRSNLLRKDFNYYSKFNWHEPLDLPYIWPTGE